MKREIFALSVVLLVLVAFPASLFGYQAWRTSAAGVRVAAITAKAPEHGGFVPDRLTLRAGEPVRLRIMTPDVVHGLTIPGLNVEIDEIYPGKVVEVDITPSTPGRYVFACTRWCGVDHWRMRGVIEVTGPASDGPTVENPPLFQQLGIDIDAVRMPALHVPQERPSAMGGKALSTSLPPDLADVNQRRSQTPADAFSRLRKNPETSTLSDAAIWDLVAWAWFKDLPSADLARVEVLYARDCAACHGTAGRGDGVAGRDLPGMAKMDPDMPAGPADFTRADRMLSAADVVLQGKLLRGGMGTGMPEFGSLYTEAELWAMVSYLRTFLFDR